MSNIYLRISIFGDGGFFLTNPDKCEMANTNYSSYVGMWKFNSSADSNRMIESKIEKVIDSLDILTERNCDYITQWFNKAYREARRFIAERQHNHFITSMSGDYEGTEIEILMIEQEEAT